MDKLIKKLKSMKLNNKGAAMVTVVVVVLFVTILATTLLYISAMNFQVKQTDYRNQKSFYYCEVPMEKFKTKFTEDASEAALLAYEDTVKNFSYLGTSEARREAYYKKFVFEIKKDWNAHSSGDWKTWLNGLAYWFVDADGDGANDIDTVDVDINAPDANGDGAYSTDEMLEIHEDKGYVLIKGIVVTTTDADGYTSIITTDFYVEAPNINWGVDAAEMTAPANMETALKKDPIEVAEFVKYVNWEKQ